jgi:hypothetical protein
MKKEEIRAELSRIYQAHGALTASAVVEEARDEESPLHESFEWDDSKAAEAHRLFQARDLIRRVEFIVIAGREERVFHVPPAIRVEGSKEGRYEIASVLAKRPSDLELTLHEAKERLAAAERYIAHLAQLDVQRASDYERVKKSVERSRSVLERVPAKQSRTTSKVRRRAG